MPHIAVAFQFPTSPSMTVSPTSSSPPVTLSPSTQVHSTDEVDAKLYVSIGVSGAVVVVLLIIATAVNGFICLRNRQSKRRNKNDAVKISENVAYGTNMDGSCTVAYGANMDMSCNVAYGTNMDMSCNVAYDTNQNEMEMNCNVAYESASFKGEDTYDYISTTDGNDIIITSPNEAYTTTNNGHTQAYGMVHH